MLFYLILGLLGILVFISIVNFIGAPRLKIREIDRDDKILPKISILIPARNEEENIANSLLSAINQTYPNKEIIIIDDKSEDNTSEKVLEIIKKYPKEDIKLYNGTELPEGWLGKCWACHNLANYASGDILLFIDADITMHKSVVESAFYELESDKNDILTIFPTQITKTLPEKIFIPTFVEWTLTSILPIPLANKLKIPSLSTANGQFMIFKKEAYIALGGHERVKTSIAEDNSIAVITKMEGKKLKIILGNELVFCRMYTNLDQCIKGFTKNYYVLSRMGNVIGYAVLNILFFIALILPFILVFFDIIYIWAILGIFLQRSIQSMTVKRSIWQNIFLHIPQILSIMYVAPKSYLAFSNNKIEWKGRIAKVHDDHEELSFTKVISN